ncbi:MAG: carboxymuconolactone decarboxylase family protein [Rhodospirillaceae bacterium]|nr:carboxymuconolactone decarboxylase family protein [Rhodospirillaceae bacterium]
MKSRMNRADFHKLAPEVRAHLGPLNQAVIDAGGIEKSLIELVKIRASQINGCAFCLDMHTREARKLGETEERLHVLAAWHESPAFTDRERAALAWTDSLTDIADGHVPDEVYDEVKKLFTEKELAYLTAAVVAINGWNRIAVAFRFLPDARRA